MSRLVITIDGLAGSGKTSLATALVEKLNSEGQNFACLKSGMLYRQLGLYFLKNDIDPEDSEALESALQQFNLAMPDDAKELFSPEVSEVTSIAAAQPAVRSYLLNTQREAYPEHNLVAEGRDMGTVVFPDADFKIFLECQPEVLAERRLKQQGQNKELKSKLKIEIEERNKRDQGRKLSPTVPAEDALIIDNSSKTLTELLNYVYSTLSAKLGL